MYVQIAARRPPPMPVSAERVVTAPVGKYVTYDRACLCSVTHVERAAMVLSVSRRRCVDWVGDLRPRLLGTPEFRHAAPVPAGEVEQSDLPMILG